MCTCEQKYLAGLIFEDIDNDTIVSINGTDLSNPAPLTPANISDGLSAIFSKGISHTGVFTHLEAVLSYGSEFTIIANNTTKSNYTVIIKNLGFVGGRPPHGPKPHEA